MKYSRRRFSKFLFFSFSAFFYRTGFSALHSETGTDNRFHPIARLNIVNSFDELRELVPRNEGQCIELKSWHQGLNEGSGEFIAVKGYIEHDDGGTLAKVNNEWFWKRIIKGHYTPEMYGVVGNGLFDDYKYFQKMLDSIPSNAVVILDGKKVYYNNFSGRENIANIWTLTKPITIFANSALLTRRTPKRIGTKDNKSSVLKLSGEGPFNLFNLRIEGANPIGKIKNHLKQDTDISGYAICDCQDFGVHIINANNIKIVDADISCCSFNIWVESSSNIKITGKLHHSGQVVPNITAKDLAYGAGVKILNSRNFDIDIEGRYNTNATVEVEPNNSFGNVRVLSFDNLSNGLVIYNSNNIQFYAYTKNTIQGNGTFIISNNGKIETGNIKGTSITEGCSWVGTYIQLKGDSGFNVSNIDLVCVSSLCDNYGLVVENKSTKLLENVRIDYRGERNSTVKKGFDMKVFGDVAGEIKGSIRKSLNGVFFDGNEMNRLNVKLDLSEIKFKHYQMGDVVKARFADK
ncbi:hypothetical protein [Klebsiella michiganensis]